MRIWWRVLRLSCGGGRWPVSRGRWSMGWGPLCRPPRASSMKGSYWIRLPSWTGLERRWGMRRRGTMRLKINWGSVRLNSAHWTLRTGAPSGILKSRSTSKSATSRFFTTSTIKKMFRPKTTSTQIWSSKDTWTRSPRGNHQTWCAPSSGDLFWSWKRHRLLTQFRKFWKFRNLEMVRDGLMAEYMYRVSFEPALNVGTYQLPESEFLKMNSGR